MVVRYDNNKLFTITRFRDGDTVEGFLQCEHCGAASHEVIRLLRIESWEPHGPTRVQAAMVAHHLTNIFGGVTLRLTNAGRTRDKYRRILTDLVHDSSTLSHWIVEHNLGWYGVGEPQPDSIRFPLSDQDQGAPSAPNSMNDHPGRAHAQARAPGNVTKPN